MLKIAVGHSNDPDTGEAIIEVLQHCQQQLADGDQPQAGILLAAIDFEFEELLEAIAQQYPDIELIGGTTDGEISSVLGFEQDSVSLMLFCSDTITIRSGIGQQLSEDVDEAVQSAVKM
ncbi:MAG: FIST N-terminal domain-containing protein, partial [Cyanobacteria bacterium P01_D01_bin.73]